MATLHVMSDHVADCLFKVLSYENLIQQNGSVKVINGLAVVFDICTVA